MQGFEVYIVPERVERGGAVAITVYGLLDHDPAGLLMQVVAGRGAAVMRPPRRLPTYASPKPGRRGVYESVIETAGYEPGEYIVDVSGSEPFRAQDAISRVFTVVPPGPEARGAGGAGGRRP